MEGCFQKLFLLWGQFISKYPIPILVCSILIFGSLSKQIVSNYLGVGYFYKESFEDESEIWTPSVTKVIEY